MSFYSHSIICACLSKESTCGGVCVQLAHQLLSRRAARKSIAYFTGMTGDEEETHIPRGNQCFTRATWTATFKPSHYAFHSYHVKWCSSLSHTAKISIILFSMINARADPLCHTVQALASSSWLDKLVLEEYFLYWNSLSKITREMTHQLIEIICSYTCKGQQHRAFIGTARSSMSPSLY